MVRELGPRLRANEGQQWPAVCEVRKGTGMQGVRLLYLFIDAADPTRVVLQVC